MNKLAIYLNQHIDGVVYSAPNILEKFSRDRSVLRYKPRLVAVPANVMDVRRLVKFSSQLANKGLSMPITPRGSGYSKTGSAIGSGIIVSMERLNHIQEIDTRQCLLRVQAGATLAEVRTALSASGLELPVFGDSHETIGGLISNCAPASVNTRPGTIMDFVQDMEIVLSDGSIIQASQMSHAKISKLASGKTFEAKIYKKISDWLGKNQELVGKLRDPEESRSWYPGIKDTYTKQGVNLAPLFCGAEGTLGVITEVILKVEHIFNTPNYIVIPCANIDEFEQSIAVLQKEKFTDAIYYDSEIFAENEKNGKSLKFFKKQIREGYLIVANVKDDSKSKRRTKLRNLQKKLPKNVKAVNIEAENVGDFDSIHEGLIAYLSENNLESRVPIIDQVYVPAEKRKTFLLAVKNLAEELKMPLPSYGSIDYDIYTVRPSLRPDKAESYKATIDFLRRYIAIVNENGGHVCGGAPEGRFLAPFMKVETNPAILKLNEEIKNIIDPHDVMNPGIKHEADARVIFKHFRTEYGGELQSGY